MAVYFPVFIFSTDNGGAHTANLPLRGEEIYQKMAVLTSFKYKYAIFSGKKEQLFEGGIRKKNPWRQIVNPFLFIKN
jgi:hypothetical protein